MHPKLVGLVDRAIAWKTSRRYHEYLAEFREMDRWSREKLLAWRWQRLQDLVRHAYETTIHWKEVLDDLGARPEDFTAPEHLRLLPRMTKDLINRHPERVTSSLEPTRPTTIKSTGGSTGKNVWLVIDMETHDRRRAAGRLTEEWDGVYPGTRTAILWGASLEARPSRASRIYDRISGRLFLSVYGVDEERLAGYFDRLESFRPEVIVSYPSILAHIARAMGKKRCRRVGARLIYTSAEALYPPVREELEEFFGAPVRNRYASREFGMIASDAPGGGGLSVCEMRLLVEKEPACPASESGELLITDLDNRSMPILRYAIGDRGCFSEEPDPSGRPWARLAVVEGRSLDVVVTPDGRAFGGTFFTLIFRPFDQSIAQFQVIQDRRDHLQIKIVTGPAYDAERRAQLERTLSEQLGASMRFDLAEVEEIPRLASGKRRFVVSLIGDAAGQGALSR